MKKITFLTLTLFVSFIINAQTTFTYNTDNVVTATNSVGCPSGDNDWARNFVMADFNIDTSADFTITSGEFGVQTTDNTGTTVTVSVYSSDTGFPGTFDTANLLGSQDVTVDETAAETIVPFTFDTPITVPAGTTAIVYTLTTPLNNNFFVGGTADETADGYLKSDNCGVADYATATSINFPDAHFYMTLTSDDAAILGVDENIFANNISLFPNPTNGDLNINFTRNFGTTNVSIINVNGQRVLTTSMEANGNNTIATNKLAAGVYFVKVTTDEGNATIKFIKN